MRTKSGWPLVGLLTMSVTPMWAHHAFSAEFDANKPVKFDDATVVKMEWVNPHTWIHIDVPVAGWQGRTMGDRSGHAERALPPRLYEAVARGRHEDCRRWLPGQRRVAQSERQESHVPRWANDLFLGSSGTGAPEQ